ncbi:hypothetical protein ACWOA2_08495 [Granulicatella elegans]|uniref:Lipoprotein n=1 Tax=Granulicatella elegans ATCC 700633 TaxID=626369 RepID=D0BNW8_9LACT|nr:hypothetical protein [Granulicatella elegans]EEW92247.1 hypothetical protein HMPREF0446_01653 [Granulicatella elegans ATCC 700633]
MKKVNFWMICLLGVFLVGCSEVVEDKGLQDKLVQQETQVKNYHLTLKQNEVKKKDVTSSTQVIANASVWSDGTGFGTRIDKTDGKATNQIEVISEGSKGAIRYYQDKWEPTISAQSSLQNVIGFTYHSVLQLAQDLSNVATWQSDGSFVYQGSDSVVRLALASMNIQVHENTKITVKMKADVKTNIIQSFSLILNEEDETIQKTYEVIFNGMNQQHKKELPL